MNAYRIIRTFGLVVLLAAGFVQCSTVQLTDHGKTIDAYLNPPDGQLMGANTPVWLAFTTPDGTVEYRKMREGIVGIAVSTFLQRQAKGENSSSTGTVGGLNVRPVPERFYEEALLRDKREVPNASRSMLEAHDDMIMKSSSVTEEEKIRRLEKQIHEASRPGNRTDASRVKRSDKKIIYPSLLVQTYYKEEDTISPDELFYTEEIIYQLAFWHAVDLRFRNVGDPDIRIHISGIIIGLGPGPTPYLGSDMVDVNKIWDEARKHWYTMSQRKDFPAEAYNIVVTMTDIDTYHTPNWPGVIAGRTTCSKSENNRFHSVAIIRDNGAFDGILPATHALGVYLGAEDDTNSGDECDSSNGFIMQSQEMVGPKNLEWSPCSLRRFSQWLRMTHVNCFDEPAEFHPSGNQVQKVFPGDVLGRRKQCQGRGYDRACNNPNMCTQMQCSYTGWRAVSGGVWCQNTGPAAEGTLCAPRHLCLDGICQCMSEDCLFVGAEQSTRST